MTGLGVLLPPLLIGAAVLVWPAGRPLPAISVARRSRRAGPRGGASVVGGAVIPDAATVRDGAPVPEELGAAGHARRMRAALGSVWHEDPVVLVRRWRLRRRPEGLVDAVLSVLDGIRPALDAGLPPARAVEIAGAGSLTGHPSAGAAALLSATSGRLRPPEIEDLVQLLLVAAEAGEPMSPIWAAFARRSGSAELGFVASAWRLSETTGAPLAAAVGRAAEGLRSAKSRRGKVAIAVAGPKATVTVLTVLPLTGPLFGLACGVDPASMYLRSGLSLASMVLGLALLVLGRFWCSRIVRAAVAA